jgi:hypothetical protein
MLDEAGIPENIKKVITFALQRIEIIIDRSIPVPTRVETRREFILSKIFSDKNYRDIMRREIIFKNNANHLTPIKEIVNYVNGKVFDNKW